MTACVRTATRPRRCERSRPERGSALHDVAAPREEDPMNIAFVGLGAMGAGIVPRLMAAGHKVTGWNRSPDKAQRLVDAGMRLAPSPRAAAAGADIAFSIVTDSAAVRTV